jgi:hypothetical protein
MISPVRPSSRAGVETISTPFVTGDCQFSRLQITQLRQSQPKLDHVEI